MADPGVKRPPKIRIKLGGQTVQAAKGLSVKRRLQQLGYPDPDATTLARVEDFLHMPPFLDGLTRSPVAWEDLVAELGVTVSNCSGSEHRPLQHEATAPEPPCKRARCSQRTPNHEHMVVDSVQPPAAAPLHAQAGLQGMGTRASDPPVPPPKLRQPGGGLTAAATQQDPSKASSAVVLVQGSRKEEHGASCLVSANPLPPKALPHICTKEEFGTGVPSSSSDQATTFAMSQSTSPTEVTAAPAMVQQRNRSEDASLTGSRPEPPSCELPPPAQQPPRSNTKDKVKPTQLSQMQLPPHKCYLPVPSELLPSASDDQARALVTAAVERKRHADKLRGHNCWTINTVVLYIESALLFMRAVECLMRLPSGSDRSSRALQLCTQTADFLLFTCKSAESLSAASVVRDCLRTLCERLVVVCLMRECQLPSAKFKDLSEKLERLLDPGRDTGPSRLMQSKSGKPSPDDVSHASSDRPAGGGRGSGHAQAAHELGQLRGQIAHASQQITRFSDLVRKSVLNFQALVEREDVRQHEAALEACMHISALSMGGGFFDGGRVIAHAYQALKCVQAL